MAKIVGPVKPKKTLILIKPKPFTKPDLIKKVQEIKKKPLKQKQIIV